MSPSAVNSNGVKASPMRQRHDSASASMASLSGVQMRSFQEMAMGGACVGGMPFILGSSWGSWGGLAFGLVFATSQEPAGTTLGATPAATRQGRAAKSGRLSIALRAGSGCEWRFPIRPPVSAETAGPPRPAPCGLFPLAALAYGYRPRGWYPPTLPSTEGVDGRAPL